MASGEGDRIVGSFEECRTLPIMAMGPAPSGDYHRRDLGALVSSVTPPIKEL